MGGAMVLLYASRACYNLAALALAPRSRLDAFDYDWYNVSDQVGPGQVWAPSRRRPGTAAGGLSPGSPTGGPGE